MKELIIEHRFRHLHLRVFKGMEDDYDLVFSSCEYPYFRVQFRNLDKINLDELYPLYRNRAWVLQWLPPRWCHYLIIGA